MNTKLQPSKAGGSAADIAKYAAALLLIVAGLATFYWFDGQWPTSLRVLAVVAGLIAATLVFLTTRKGGHSREFLSEARFELRKVVWPTRQEAMRTTWVVIGVVILLSLLLAFFDLIIQNAIKWLLAAHS
jgi:preprotein translocase subunit SecE